MKVSVQFSSLVGIFVIAALLTGCAQPVAQTIAQATAAQRAPTQAPTLPRTDRPTPPAATPSQTPEPSPSPRSTATLTPTSTSVTTTTETNIPDEANMTLLAVGNSLYQSGAYVMAATLYTEMLDREQSPEVYSLRAETYSRMGDFESAIADYLAAVQRGTNDNPVDDLILNNLCWSLGITGQPEKALPYCEQAVEADPSATYRDSRGVSYAQVGRLDEARADFQAVVDELESATDASLKAVVTQRQEWIDALQGGANPFTPEVLAQLCDQEIAVVATSTPVPATVKVPRADVQESASKAGFTFSGLDASSGEAILTGNWEEGACKAVLKLVGSEDGLTAGSLQASGCTDDEQSGLSYWFMASLLPGEREQAKAIVYLALGVYYVIEGEIETTGEQQIGNVIFETRRVEAPTPVLEVSAYFKR